MKEDIKALLEKKSNKKILIIYLIITIALFLLINSECLYLHYKFIIIASAISIILGLFSLFYYFKNENELHKVAFISIIGFGIITAIITPILAAPDE